MSEVLRYVLPGRPVSWERKRIAVIAGRPRVFTSREQEAAKRAHHYAALSAYGCGRCDDAHEYEVEITAHYKGKRVGDADRIPGLALDALQGVVYKVDQQISDLIVRRRRYSKPERTEVVVRRVG